MMRVCAVPQKPSPPGAPLRRLEAWPWWLEGAGPGCAATALALCAALVIGQVSAALLDALTRMGPAGSNVVIWGGGGEGEPLAPLSGQESGLRVGMGRWTAGPLPPSVTLPLVPF